MEMAELASLPEASLSPAAVLLVMDRPAPPTGPDRALASLPANLQLRPRGALPGAPGVWAVEPVPPATRVGPLEGVRRRPGEVPAHTDRTYFWRLHDLSTGRLTAVLDGRDTRRSNWMRHVVPAYQAAGQNLVAFQDGQDIFFLTCREVRQGEELAVWFCPEMAGRLGLPRTGTEMVGRVLEAARRPPAQNLTTTLSYKRSTATPSGCRPRPTAPRLLHSAEGLEATAEVQGTLVERPEAEAAGAKDEYWAFQPGQLPADFQPTTAGNQRRE
jgi:hypothetical protein